MSAAFVPNSSALLDAVPYDVAEIEGRLSAMSATNPVIRVENGVTDAGRNRCRKRSPAKP